MRSINTPIHEGIERTGDPEIKNSSDEILDCYEKVTGPCICCVVIGIGCPLECLKASFQVIINHFEFMSSCRQITRPDRGFCITAWLLLAIITFLNIEIIIHASLNNIDISAGLDHHDLFKKGIFTSALRLL